MSRRSGHVCAGVGRPFSAAQLDNYANEHGTNDGLAFAKGARDQTRTSDEYFRGCHFYLFFWCIFPRAEVVGFPSPLARVSLKNPTDEFLSSNTVICDQLNK